MHYDPPVLVPGSDEPGECSCPVASLPAAIRYSSKTMSQPRPPPPPFPAGLRLLLLPGRHIDACY